MRGQVSQTYLKKEVTDGIRQPAFWQSPKVMEMPPWLWKAGFPMRLLSILASKRNETGIRLLSAPATCIYESMPQSGLSCSTMTLLQMSVVHVKSTPSVAD